MKVYLRPHNHGSIGWSLDLNRFLYIDKNYSKRLRDFRLAELKRHAKDASLQIESPLEVTWHITSKCNMNCEYCLDTKGIQDLTEKEESHVIEKIEKSRILRVNISGGEPLIHKRLISVLKKLKRNKHWVSITTNGYVAPSFITKIAPLVDQIMISIDSMDKKELMHFKRTQKEDLYKKIVKTVEKCLKLKIPIRISTLISKQHHQDSKELRNFIKKVKSWGVKELSLIQFSPQGLGKSVKSKYYMTDKEYFSIVEAYRDKFENKNFRIIARNIDRYKGYLIIRPNGLVYTLDKNGKEVDVGNILKQDFEDLFTPIIFTFYSL